MIRLWIALVLLLQSVVSAALLQVGPGGAFADIQSAITAASPGDTIEVGPGIYAENVVVNKSPLILRGNQAGQTARDRITGPPNPAIETIIAPASGPSVELSSGDGAVTVSGFALVADVPHSTGVVISTTPLANGLVLSDNHIAVASGADGPALALRGNAHDATLADNVFLAASTSLRTVLLQGSNSFHGLYFLRNDVLRVAPLANTGLFVDGNRNLGPSILRAPLVSENRFEGHQLGFDAGPRSLKGAEISQNVFINNAMGLSAGPEDCILRDNQWTNNAIHGLRLDSFGNASDPAYGAQSSTIEHNDFQGNGTSMDPGGSGDLVLGDQAAGTHSSNIFFRNRFLSAVAVTNLEIGASPALDKNYWNAPDGPGGLADGSGGQILGILVNYAPFYSNSDFTSLNFGGNPLTGALTLGSGESIESSGLTIAPTGILTLAPGSSMVVDDLQMQNGSGLFVRNGSVQVGSLDLQAGAVLDVIDGDLILDPMASGHYHTISGSFTFFNSLGSLNINGDTSFSGHALCLASNIHVAPDVTLLVLGNLILDGCELDSTGTFSILVNSGATFNMVRCSSAGAFINLVGSDVLLRDNHFMSGLITVFSTVSGANIFHNIFDSGASALNTLPGAVINDTMEGWGNVDDADDVQNALSLEFQPPIDPTRTLDDDGNLYIQPGDPLMVGLHISKLNTTTQTIEALLGFSTDYLNYDSLAPSSEWNNGLHEMTDASEVIGRFNTAVGLSFNPAKPDGTTDDGLVGDIELEAKAVEGLTRFFFRSKGAGDPVYIDTRLTVSSSGTPSYLHTPFTGNTALLTIDGTAPEFGITATATQIQNGSPVDVLQSGNLTEEGTVTITYDARDALAGVDDVDASVLLTGALTSLTGVLTSMTLVDIGGTIHTRHTFDVAIPASTPNGVYDVDGVVMDRSGNSASLSIGAIEIARFRIEAEVECQELVAGPLTRDVVFTATDGTGAVLASWSTPVIFTNAIGTASLADVPADSVNLSAKTAWNLRVRRPLTFDSTGLATTAFTGPNLLLGGDFSGDNVVALADYNILNAFFASMASEPDINGDGVVSLFDFQVFRSNWLTSGDPL